MEADKTDFCELIISLLLVACVVLLIIKVMDSNPLLSRDEICQKHFGKDYVWQSGHKSADFCIDSSGIPKYPKTWNERKSNA